VDEVEAAPATTPDGKSLIGLPTDTGGLAICYRQDLFAKAGLPTDPAKVSAMFTTWDDYVATVRSSSPARPRA
jgi:cellobiose transport system substrate-binding protein